MDDNTELFIPMSKILSLSQYVVNIFPRSMEPCLKVFRLYIHLKRVLKLRTFVDKHRIYSIYFEELTDNLIVNKYLVKETDPNNDNAIFVLCNPESLYDELWEAKHYIIPKKLRVI